MLVKREAQHTQVRWQFELSICTCFT